MRTEKANRRLRELEEKLGVGRVVLHFADGSSRSIKIKKKTPLHVFCAVCTKLASHGPSPSILPEGMTVEPKPCCEPASPHDPLIEMLVKCDSVEGAGVFLGSTILGLVHQLRDRRLEGQTNAP